LLTTVTVLALAFVAVALVARAQPVSSIPRLILAVGSTFVPLAALFGLALAIVGRRRILAIVAVFLLTATLAIQVNWYVVSNPKNLAGPVAELRVLSSNLRYGRAEPAGFVKLAKENADVITVAELTPEAIERFNASIGFDIALLQDDLDGSVAHARMLGGCGVISEAEAEQPVSPLVLRPSGSFQGRAPH
jgi:hypothetical protein